MPNPNPNTGHRPLDITANDAVSTVFRLRSRDPSTGVRTPVDLTGATVTGKVRDMDTTNAVAIDLDAHLSITDAANGEITLGSTIGAAAGSYLTAQGSPASWSGEYTIKVLFSGTDPRTYLKGSFTIHIDGGRAAV